MFCTTSFFSAAIAAAALALFAAPAAAAEAGNGVHAGGLQIVDAWSRATARAGANGVGYVTIMNGGETDDRLVAVRADFAASAGLHITVTRDGGMRMTPIDAIENPAGEAVTLQPGGMHIMFMGLSAALVEGATIDAALVFEHVGEVGVTFQVQAAGQAQAAGAVAP